jgi:hydroxymethylbilane synthase
MMPARLRAATRGSELARVQTGSVVDRLDAEVDVVVVTTTGDRRSDAPIQTMGGVGVFVKEVQEAVLTGAADIAVHSAKDLPAVTPPGLVLAAIPERGDPRDALVGSTLEALPVAARVGTGAVRRRAQLAGLRPDLVFGDLRGNIGTRLEKAAQFDVVVVAAVALDRLALDDRITQRLDPAVVLPQVGQGAIAVECRADDDRVRALLEELNDASAYAAVVAERAFLAQLGGGCNLPCGALAVATDEGVEIEVLLASLDGHSVLRARASGSDPVEVGTAAARRLLDECGGRSLLADVS